MDGEVYLVEYDSILEQKEKPKDLVDIFKEIEKTFKIDEIFWEFNNDNQ